MPEYIEREAILKAYEEEQRRAGPWRFETLINSVHAADVAPVVHGRWVLKAEKGHCRDFQVKAHCSECGYEWFSKDGIGNYSSVFGAFVHGTDEDAIAFVLHEASKRKLFGFCPKCGAKMGKEGDDGLDTP